ncbi:IS21 family transposase, partial [Bacillus mycoides]
PVEKQHLQPVSSPLSYQSVITPSITRNISKDNTIRFKSNRYSVPLGTYSAVSDNEVFIEVTSSQPPTLIIRKQLDGEVIAEHSISNEKGKLIQHLHHIRDRSKGIEEFKQQLVSHFEDQERATSYLNEICLRYPRYRRDQLIIIQNVIEKYPMWIEATLTKCLIDKLYSANDFRDIANHQNALQTECTQKVKNPFIKHSSQDTSVA